MSESDLAGADFAVAGAAVDPLDDGRGLVDRVLDLAKAVKPCRRPNIGTGRASLAPGMTFSPIVTSIW